MKKEDLIEWFRFCSIKGLGPMKILKLLSIFGSPERMWNASNEELVRTRILKEPMITQWTDLKHNTTAEYEKRLTDCSENKIRIIPIFDDMYPIQLKFMPSPPLNLFVKGDVDLLNRKKVAVVGSRGSDDNAKKWAYDKASELVKKGITIVSGGAKGVDIEAHKAALDNGGSTICVLGAGFFNYFPQEHANIFDEISSKGLLVSEYYPSFKGTAISLASRNRITSGISDCILVVTSQKDGGTMVQMKKAHEQKIPIFAPKTELNLLPNEGVKDYLLKYNIIMIDNIKPVLDEINKSKPFFMQTRI